MLVITQLCFRSQSFPIRLRPVKKHRVLARKKGDKVCKLASGLCKFSQQAQSMQKIHQRTSFTEKEQAHPVFSLFPYGNSDILEHWTRHMWKYCYWHECDLVRFSLEHWNREGKERHKKEIFVQRNISVIIKYYHKSFFCYCLALLLY